MPRIDPLSLLKCLSVLLGPSGGIKSKEEVHRLANLMTKFSKKLVSKCIYIQILKTTNTELLGQFMGAGGWNLVHMWLTDGILAKNWALIQELLELLLLCPVDIERLKSNNCPKLIKGLSKEGSHQGVRCLASRLVEQWLKIVKGEAAPNSVPAQILTVSGQPVTTQVQFPIASITQDNQELTFSTIEKPVTNNVPAKKSFVVVSSASTPTVPVYKITIRDGKQVLAKVETDAANINSVLKKEPETNGDVAEENVIAEDEEVEEHEEIEQRIPEIQLKAEPTESTGKPDKTEEEEETKLEVTEGGKSSDKENREQQKKDEKKSASTDKRSHHSSSKSSSSTSSSKHGSSHRSDSHRSHRKSSSSSSKSKERDRDRHHSSSKHSSSSSSKNRSERDREREKEKEKQKKDQAEKDKATLEKVQGQALKMGKIPKKRPEDESSSSSSRKSSTDSRDSSKENKADPKKVPEKKNISMSIESRKNSQDSTRPKTVKTFNSKFRSTGLEEEAKPPPPRIAKKPAQNLDKKPAVPVKPSGLKRPSPPREQPVPEKKARLSLDSPGDEKRGGIKLIPPKPKPMVLQESDMFMDALTASTKSKETRKRKRRTSISKDGSTEPKKVENNADGSRDTTPPPTSPSSADEKSPVSLKPNFKFYQDTLETDEDKEEKEKEKTEDDSKMERDEESDDQKSKEVIEEDERSSTPTPDDESEEAKALNSPEEADDSLSSKKESTSPNPEIRYVDGLRSVLLLQKRKGPKKSLKWKTELESIRYFELDETERVNVTKTFTDMKQMEKQNEREAFQMARKLSTEDLMEEKTTWKPLIPIDLSPALVEPGKDSREKDIQYAREKGILQALYFNRSMIPDSAAEPDEERHPVITDPKVIPLDDLTGNKESEKDFTAMTWPEPKPQLAPAAPPMTNFHYQGFPHGQQPMMPQGVIGPMGPIGQMPQPMMGPGPMGQMPAPDMGPMAGGGGGGGGWRTGDGKVVVPDVSMNPMAGAMPTFPQAGPEGPMGPPGMMGPPIFGQQDGFGMMGPEEMGFNNMPTGFQGPPAMFGPGLGPNFQGPRGAGPMGNRGRGGPGPGWYRGGRGGWRGGGGWRGNGKQPQVCRQFSKNGYCRVGDKCQYLHPGVNCPPF
ncbi:serine/threonine-protein phosphatase 1 regulatory subunit 10 isoform X2 [Cephus cinctus]|uniref:Serine/threonine-protein phosphatase 1 regulatory subunit 10 isoform X2 n=1 Tax=Cephus cinctus TaxID=211228 RepID=A0AAJ7C7W2_CEPCN|nr:serine/threonine-protein phosphatase 1 regulatory subunit 10 isoform X2 [Cephus cinctus]XP_015604064.1 serine/threonine-protein phosphatase 1 regulatory subunit 10 isoform X2 [Cephus cinctus]XP_024945001.1 serine/threonine-protein phosphatase 1 regulatory subunit 10 isoform X2 [Cephus cinctus]